MIKVIKIGGNVVDNEEVLESFCRDFAAIEGPKILVHGGGVMANKFLPRLGIEPQMVEGRRVTDLPTLQVVTMVYSGWCNKHICALLQSAGCNAIGLSGCDANVVKASKRAPKTLSDGVTVVDYGYVGDVNKASIDADRLEMFVQQGLTPVLCAINHDGDGQLLNTNADTVAQSIASAVGGELVCCFELDGVLADKNDPSSVIASISADDFEKMKESGAIVGGMIPKVENCLKSLKDGAVSAVIKNACNLLKPESGTFVKL